MSKRMQMLLVLLVGLVSISLSIIGCSSSPATSSSPVQSSTQPSNTSVPTSVAADKVYTLRWVTMSSIVKSPAAWAATFQGFVDDVKQKSNGRLVIQLYPNFTLVDQKGLLDALRQGLVDIGDLIPGNYGGYFPMWALGTIPQPWHTVTQGWRVVEQIYDQYLKNDNESIGLHGFGWNPVNPANFFSLNKEVDNMDGFKGITVQNAQPVEAQLLKSMGMVGVNMTSSDIYENLSKGVIDSVVYPAQLVWSNKYYELGKPGYMVDTGGIDAGTLIDYAMNMKVWNSLPPDLQQIFTDEANKINPTRPDFSLKDEVDAWTGMKAKGTHIIVWTDAEKARMANANSSFTDNWAKGLDAKGLPGTQMEAKIRAITPDVIKQYPSPVIQK